MEQTELCRSISKPAKQKEKGTDVPADSVTLETAGTKFAIIKVNNTSRKCRKIKIDFWNVAGLDNENAQFWEYIKQFDIIGMEGNLNRRKELEQGERTSARSI